MNPEEQRMYDEMKKAGACKMQLRSMERDFDLHRTSKRLKNLSIVFMTILLIVLSGASWLLSYVFGVNMLLAYMATVVFGGIYVYSVQQVPEISNEVARELMDVKYPELEEWDKD